MMIQSERRVRLVSVVLLLSAIMGAMLFAVPPAHAQRQRPVRRRASLTISVRPSARLQARARKLARRPVPRRVVSRRSRFVPRPVARTRRVPRPRPLRRRPVAVKRPRPAPKPRRNPGRKVQATEVFRPTPVPTVADPNVRKQLQSAYRDIEAKREKAIKTAQEKARHDIAGANSEAQNRRNDVLKTLLARNETEAARREIQRSYSESNAAFVRKDVNGVLRNRSSDYIAVTADSAGKKKLQNLAQTRSGVAGFFKTMISSTSKSQVMKLQLTGKEAVVTAKEVGHIRIRAEAGKEAILDTITTSTDTWVRQNGKWRMRRSDNIVTDVKVNGKRVGV